MKLIVTQDTFAPSMDGPTFLPANSLVELETASARGVVEAGKGLYIEPKDDPTTRGNAPGRWTASAEQVAAIRAALKKTTKVEA